MKALQSCSTSDPIVWAPSVVKRDENMREPAASGDRVHVAIIGTGLAGLTTAYLLQNDENTRYRVTLFEQVCCMETILCVSRLVDQLLTHSAG